jgi:hypothetical protein
VNLCQKLGTKISNTFLSLSSDGSRGAALQEHYTCNSLWALDALGLICILEYLSVFHSESFCYHYTFFFEFFLELAFSKYMAQVVYILQAADV